MLPLMASRTESGSEASNAGSQHFQHPTTPIPKILLTKAREVGRAITKLTLPELVPQESKCLRDKLGDYDVLKSLPPPRNPLIMECNFRVPSILSLSPRTGFLDAVNVRMRGMAWFLLLLWPQILFGLFVVFFQWASTRMWGWPMVLSDSAQNFHQLFGTILSFTIGFRTNAAYRTFADGQDLVGKLCGHIREVVLTYYVVKVKEDHNPDEVERIRINVRRCLNVLYAFVRQDVRESVLGFIPGSNLEGIRFTDETFYLDPIRPRLWDLLNEDDVSRYSLVSPSQRPLMMVGEIRAITELYANKVEYLVPFITRVNASLQGCLDVHESMQRIRDNQVPFPYVYILAFITFAFCYSTPFMYSPGVVGAVLGVEIMVFAYYGMLAIALQLENPFRFGSHQLDLEHRGLRLHNDTLKLATVLADDRVSFIPDDLPKEGVRFKMARKRKG